MSGVSYLGKLLVSIVVKKGTIKDAFGNTEFSRKKKCPNEQVIGKRISVKKQSVNSSDMWLEGKIANFHSDTGKHEILFDWGIVEHYRLDSGRSDLSSFAEPSSTTS